MVEKPNRLGRGLAALIGDMAPIDAPRIAESASGGQKRLPLDFITANRANPRRDFDTDQLDELTNSIKEKGVMITTKKMYDNQLPEWTQELIQSKGLAISPKGLALLVDHIGNDLNRIENEIDKLSVNLGKRKTITEEDIESFIGVSKDFNVFELQGALARKDVVKAFRIIQYFEANPKAAPIQLVLPSLYSFFSKAFMVFGAASHDEKTVAASLGVKPFFVKDYMQAANLYNYAGEPWKTQYWIREVMNRLYKPAPDGYCGDEDNGQT